MSAGTAVAWRPVRRHLRAVRRSHGTRSLRDLAGLGYESLLYLAVLGGVAVNALRTGAASLATPPPGAGWWLGATALLAAAGGLASVLLAFGPLVTGPAYASWLLPSPLDRAGLLAGRAAAVTATSAVLAALVAGLADAGMGGADPIGTGAAAGAGAATVAAACLLAQAGGPRADRVAGLVTRAVLGAALLAAAALVVAVRSGVDPAAPPGAAAGAVAALLAVPAVLACGAAWSRLGRVRARALTRGTPLIAALVAGSVASDPSLTAGVIGERRLLRRAVVRSRRNGAGRRRALLAASLRSAARNHPACAAAVALAVLTHVAGVLVPPVVLPALQLAGATAVAAGFAVPLRAVTSSAALRRALGGRDRELVALHCVVPFAAVLGWTLVVAPAAGSAVSLVLLPLSALAVVVRHATRPPRAATMTLYDSPVGVAVPVEIVQDLSRGPLLFLVLAAVQTVTG